MISLLVPLTGDNFTAFNGVISDVEFYDSAANEVQASAIYDVNLIPQWNDETASLAS